MAEEEASHLVLFDFDHTVCDGNTDTWILRALPPLPDEHEDGDTPRATTAAATPRRPRAHVVLPRALRDPAPGGWTAFMQAVFDYAHGKGVFAADFRRELQSLPLTPGFLELLREIERAAAAAAAESGDGGGAPPPPPPRVRAGIISDSNSLFIDWTLEAHGLDARGALFAGAGVHTNPATLADGGRRLLLEPHEPPRPGGGHGCPACPPNMCKGKRLRAIVGGGGNAVAAREEGAGARADAAAAALCRRPRVAYVGDGGNDACAAAALQRGDVVFARRGMALDARLTAGGEGATAAEVVRWESGAEILEWLRRVWGLFV